MMMTCKMDAPRPRPPLAELKPLSNTQSTHTCDCINVNLNVNAPKERSAFHSVIGAKLLDGRFRLLQRDEKRVPFIEHFCDTARIFIKEVKSWHGVGLHNSGSASWAFSALSIITVTAKRERCGCNRRVSIERFFFRSPAFCCFAEIGVIWVSGAQTIIIWLHRVGPLFSFCGAALQIVICWHHWLEVSFFGLWAEGAKRAPPPPQLNQNPELRRRARDFYKKKGRGGRKESGVAENYKITHERLQCFHKKKSVFFKMPLTDLTSV